MQFNEPGVFVSFEETSEELATNVRSLGFDLDDLIRRKKLAMDFVRVERAEVEETGEYDLEGLFVRLNMASDCGRTGQMSKIGGVAPRHCRCHSLLLLLSGKAGYFASCRYTWQ